MTRRGSSDSGLPRRASGLGALGDPAPHARLLGNGTYSVLVTGAGSGVSRFADHELTAWSADRTEDGEGLFLYLRDRDDGRFWSAGARPTGGRPDSYAASYAAGTVRLTRLEHGIESCVEICVSPVADLELRRVTLRNLGTSRRRLELTTYAEVVLNQRAAHAAHPAFQKLFVQTEHDAPRGILLARRRPRSAEDQHPWLMHALLGAGSSQHETDRARFVGRGRSLAAPRALCAAAPLSGTTGSVLDPILSLRRSVELEPGATAVLHAVLAAAATRDALLELAAQQLNVRALDDGFALAATHETELAAALGLDVARAEALQDLLGAMLYGAPALRAPEHVLRGAHDAHALTQLPIARDAAFAAVRVAGAREIPLLRELLTAQRYWQAKGFAVGVVALCSGAAEVAAAARTALAEEGDDTTVAARAAPPPRMVLHDAAIPPRDHDCIAAAARLVLPVARGDAAAARGARPAPAATARPAEAARAPSPHAAAGTIAGDGLLFWNGTGGFAGDGTEYVIRLGPDERPPMPWANVIANEGFGFLVSESGAACTWSRNSRENRLTPWLNDPVRDAHAEALYVRDDDARLFWSPQPGPAPSGAACEVRHGLGYTVWRQSSHELEQQVTAFVARGDPVKMQCVELTNTSARPRRLSVFCYHRLVLGGAPGDSDRFAVTELDPASGALFARNRLNGEFADGVVFAAACASGAGPSVVHCTADRTAFIGRNGAAASPAALGAAGTLDGTVGAGLDPCAALQLVVEIEPHATVACTFLLGEATSDEDARALITRYRSADRAAAALAEAQGFWRELTGAVQVATPSRVLDLMVNGWLLYQALSCRMWGRSALYQSGGAIGFRDQLQDSAAFTLVRPELARAQLVQHAAHQLVEGDVLHWWHPPTGRGIRTRFADDLCWLPYLTATYVRATGDLPLLDERVGFLCAPPLAAGEDETYVVPTPAPEDAALYEHCCRALDRSLTSGAHGLPLMGTGDWNDGMNRVGREGRGESVWMAFFLYRILDDFVPLCARRGDEARVTRYRAYQRALVGALERHAWDGAWYRRAYYDDGSPLGAAADLECRIDALAQAWATLSGAVPRARAERAMDAVEELLVDDDAGLVRLLTPPFDRDPRDPGYIKGYLPGIRENGGQYTHAALWVAQAMAALGRRDRALELFEMLTPIAHGCSAAAIATYQVEPYVVAADVYGVAPHVGRGGWTWYTGSAGWMYRIAVESLLGLRLEDGTTLCIRPCVPDAWPGFTLRLDLDGGRARYDVEVVTVAGDAARVLRATVDGAPATVADGTARIALARDGVQHRVLVELGA